MNYHTLYINGEWVVPHGTDRIKVENPANGEIIQQVASGDREDVEQAVAAAKKGFEKWKNTSLEERIQLVKNFIQSFEEKKEEIRECIVSELGVSQWHSHVHVDLPIKEMHSLLEDIHKVKVERKIENALIIKEPFGPVACICPWNYPAMQITRKIVPAFLTGNTVVLKPASATPMTAWHIAECVHRAGFPKGVFNMVAGSGNTVGEWICSHPDIAVISFTGSEQVGRKMYQYGAEGIKHLVLELGGKSPAILLPDGSMEQALQITLSSVFSNVGQTCSALTRLFIPKHRMEEFKEKLDQVYQVYTVGDPQDPSVRVGSLCSAAQYEKVKTYLQLGLKEGATLYKGRVPQDEEKEKGYFVTPAVFLQVTNQMRIAQEEIFGPVLSVIEYEHVQDAITMANDNAYGLSGAVFGSPEEALKVAKQLDTGNVYINKAPRSSKAPFGGYKASGVGRENGIYALEELLQTKAVFLEE